MDLRDKDILFNITETDIEHQRAVYRAVVKVLDFFLKEDENFIKHYYDRESGAIRIKYREVTESCLTEIQLGNKKGR